MADQHHGTWKACQGFFEHFQRRDIEIIGGLIEQQKVGRLHHHLRHAEAGLLATGEGANGHVQLLILEQETLGPSQHMVGSVLEFHRFTVRTQGLFQVLGRIERCATLLKHHGS